MNYFFEDNSYSSLRDILKSPYFQIKMSNHEKNKLLERIVLHQKGNININIVNYKNKFFDEYFKSNINLEDRCSFNNIKNFIDLHCRDYSKKNSVFFIYFPTKSCKRHYKFIIIL